MHPHFITRREHQAVDLRRGLQSEQSLQLHRLRGRSQQRPHRPQRGGPPEDLRPLRRDTGDSRLQGQGIRFRAVSKVILKMHFILEILS